MHLKLARAKAQEGRGMGGMWGGEGGGGCELGIGIVLRKLKDLTACMQSGTQDLAEGTVQWRWASCMPRSISLVVRLGFGMTVQRQKHYSLFEAAEAISHLNPVCAAAKKAMSC